MFPTINFNHELVKAAHIKYSTIISLNVHRNLNIIVILGNINIQKHSKIIMKCYKIL